MGLKKILFLHTELAGYFVACLDTLINNFEVEVHVVRFPVNKEAPFEFFLPGNITFYERQAHSNKELFDLCKGIDADFIFCAGWIDKTYLRICKSHFRKIPTVIVLDNHWTGSLKQQIAALASPAVLLQTFSNIWIPGLYQFEYAKRLGFKRDEIITGMYSADVSKFVDFYHEFKDEKKASFPKRFLYVGRYIASKGVNELWEAFQELYDEGHTDWELWSAGAGPLENCFPKHKNMRNFGFLQPQELRNVIKGSGTFVLPSHSEPWGVVVHEFAACGMPLICSNEVGASSAFLISGYNGFLFKAKNKAALKKAMLRMIQSNDSAIQAMSERSLGLAQAITPTIWATKIWELANEN